MLSLILVTVSHGGVEDMDWENEGYFIMARIRRGWRLVLLWTVRRSMVRLWIHFSGEFVLWFVQGGTTSRFVRRIELLECF